MSQTKLLLLICQYFNKPYIHSSCNCSGFVIMSVHQEDYVSVLFNPSVLFLWLPCSCTIWLFVKVLTPIY